MRNISLRQIRTVLALTEHGKVSAAARALGLTSPAVTIQLQQMEEELGFELFTRTRSGVMATEAGEIVIETAKRITGEIASLEERLAALKGVAAGTIRLGVVSTGKYFAPRVLAAFNKLYPGVQMRLVAANRAEIIDRLRNYEIDVALMGRPPKEIDVRSRVFGDHPLVFIAPAGHALAQQIEITKERIAQEQFIVREKGSGTRISLEIFLSDIPGRLDHLGTEMDSNETIKQAVIAGLGVAFISAHTIEQEVRNGSLRVLDVIDTPIRRQWFSVSRASPAIPPAIEAFEVFLQDKGARYLPLVTKPYPASAFDTV